MDTCAKCGWSPPPESVDPGTTRDLARVGSVAEAGYLVALLQEAGLSAAARANESFNAVQGAWQIAYVVSVPTTHTQLASRILQAEANDAFGDVSGRVFDDGEPGEQALVNPWRMLTVLAVVAAAGAVMAADTFGVGGRGRHEAARQAHLRGGPAEPIDHLSGALRTHEAPFRSDPVAGGPRRMLRYLPRLGAWELLTDADHDGRYESRRRFSDPQLAPQAAAR